MAYFWLTPPSRAVFIISVFLALLALLVRYANAAIPVVAARRGATGTLTLITLDLDAARGMISLIEAAPLLMLNGPPSHGFGQGQYLLVQDFDEQRWTRLATEPARLFVLQVQEVDRPPLDVAVPKQNTWAEWLADPEGTYAGWRARTHLDVLTEEGVP